MYHKLHNHGMHHVLSLSDGFDETWCTLNGTELVDLVEERTAALVAAEAAAKKAAADAAALASNGGG
jgi:hypothetical protein